MSVRKLVTIETPKDKFGFVKKNTWCVTGVKQNGIDKLIVKAEVTPFNLFQLELELGKESIKVLNE